MARFSAWLQGLGREWPGNLWAGTSIMTQANTGMIDSLLQVGNKDTIRFLSVEPQHESLDLGPRLSDLHWVIQGGESGKDWATGEKAREFKLEWAYDMRDHRRAARVPYFLKQLGSNASFEGQALRLRHSHGGDWSEWQKALRVRKMPSVNVERSPSKMNFVSS
jgi:protein gp37